MSVLFKVSAPRLLALFSVSLLVLLLTLSWFQPAGKSVLKITGVDPVAYYGTAHSVLYDRDFDLTNQYAALKPLRNEWNANVPATGKPGAPFPVGFSLLELPFLAMAAVAERVLYGQADGYSDVSVLFWYIGIIVYLGLGLQFLVPIMRTFSRELLGAGHREPPDGVLVALILMLWCGTTLGYYSFSPMAHVAAFFSSSLMWLAWIRARGTERFMPWMQLGAAAGLMFVCRWQDVLLLLIPLSWELRRMVEQPALLRSALFWGQRLSAIACFALVALVQFAQWHAVYGRWITVPQGDGFIALPPAHVMQVLFSTQHGWFAWTPLTLLGCAGLLVACRRMSLLSVALVAVVGLQVLLVGAVSTWHGHIFGLRYLTSLVPLLGVGLLCLWQVLVGWRRVVVVLLALGCVTFTLLFAVQYRLGLIPANDRLTFDEWVTDKLHLSRSLARARLQRAAQAELSQSHPDKAWNLNQEAVRQFGDSLELIDQGEAIAAQLPASARYRAELLVRRQQHEQRLLF